MHDIDGWILRRCVVRVMVVVFLVAFRIAFLIQLSLLNVVAVSSRFTLFPGNFLL